MGARLGGGLPQRHGGVAPQPAELGVFGPSPKEGPEAAVSRRDPLAPGQGERDCPRFRGPQPHPCWERAGAAQRSHPCPFRPLPGLASLLGWVTAPCWDLGSAGVFGSAVLLVPEQSKPEAGPATRRPVFGFH